MTLIIAYAVLALHDVGPVAYILTFFAWLGHLGYHHVSLEDVEDALAQIKKTLEGEEE